MNEFLLKMAMPIVMNIVTELLSAENVQKYGDDLFDFIEEAVENSKTTIDDATVIPIIKALRVGLNIPDNDK